MDVNYELKILKRSGSWWWESSRGSGRGGGR